MNTDMSRSAVEQRLWDEIDRHQVGMLTLTGAASHHGQPMTAFVERDTRRQIWFFTRADGDLIRDIGHGHAAMFSILGRDVQACIGGELRAQYDRSRMDHYWNAVVAAWYPQGREDPNLTMLCLHCDDADVWIAQAGPMRFAWEIALANATHRTPHVGARSHLDFH